MNTNYRLQICSHAEVFQTREAAMTYINRYFMPDNLLGEPTFYFYGDTESPNVILAVGLGDRKFATVDLGLTNENLEEISDSLGTDSENLNKAIATIKGIISSTGLTFDSNKVENQVSYEPDVKDELIGEANTLAEAVDLISKFVQNNVKSINFIPKDSKSISMIYEPSEDGMTLKSAIKISEYGDADENDDNNNIIGLKLDGIYATVNIEYDEDKNQLSFVTSGMKNGKFMDDANRKIINFGSHTQYTPDNEGYNVNLVVDKTRNTISANVKLSEDPNNILLIQDEKLFVDGRAANIKYKNGTVYSGINKLETSLEELKENVDTELETIKKHISDVEENTTIIGDTTDTMVITATKESNVGYKISGGVRLGDDKTIIHKDGGLEVDIEITCDATKNKLIVRTGNIIKEVELPVVSLINDAYYDSTTQEIVISFDNGNHVRIPMSGLITTYTFENNTASPVVFQVNNKSRSTEKVVTTLFRLASNDNILSINENGELAAPKSAIDNAVAVETENRVAEDNKLSEAIQAEVQRATNAEQTLTVSLNTEIERAKAAEQVNKDAISGVSKAVSDVNAKVETNTAAITLLNADDTTDGSVKYYAKQVHDILTDKVSAEQSRAENVETSLSDRIYSLESKVDMPTSSVLEEAKKYTDSSIATNNTQIGIDINAAKTEAIETAATDATTKADNALTDAKLYADNGLALKANSADVYTKDEIDSKGYLTSVDLSDYAMKTDVVAETNRAQAAEKINSDAIDALEDRASVIENNISLLQAEDRRLNLIPVETNTVSMTVSKQDTGASISGDVKVDASSGNIIKINTNGLYASVALNYNKAENRLSLTINGTVVNEFELSDHSLVQEGHYDSSTQSIVLTIVKDGGETQQISIPIGDIINEWTVDNGTNNPISLSKTTGVDGVDVLKAELEISTEAHNAILNSNGTLYVSNRAQDMTALWGGDEITIQKAIENIKTETDKVAGIASDVETLKSDMTQVKNDITVLKGEVDTLEVKVEQNTQNITQNTNSINTLTEQVAELETKVDSYENRITNIETNVQNIQNNINQITEDINSIKDEIGGEGSGESIISRLTKLEEQVNNLIDFGNFS